MAKDINGREVKVGHWLIDTKNEGLDGRVEHIDGDFALLSGQDEWVKTVEFEIEGEDNNE